MRFGTVIHLGPEDVCAASRGKAEMKAHDFRVSFDVFAQVDTIIYNDGKKCHVLKDRIGRTGTVK